MNCDASLKVKKSYGVRMCSFMGTSIFFDTLMMPYISSPIQYLAVTSVDIH